MAIAVSHYPVFPPGFWRRITVSPALGTVAAGLEDDVHRFLLSLDHEAGTITRVQARAERFPWTTCPDAGDFLAEQLVGRRLDGIAGLDPHIHCTHLYDLAVLCARYADHSASVQFDLQVADRVDGRTTATATENGALVLEWQLNGTLIEGPDEWAGRDLRQLSIWKHRLSRREAIWSSLLRRAVFVSGVRAYREIPGSRASDRGAARLGACFTYQMPRAGEARQSDTGRIDFSTERDGPLWDLDLSQLSGE